MRRVLENLGLWTVTLIALVTTACTDERTDTTADAQQSVQPTTSNALTQATTPTPTPDTTDIFDDYADYATDATVVAIGKPVEGSVDYEGDVDCFRFQAEAGQFYRIYVTLGAQWHAEAILYDSKGNLLGDDNDSITSGLEIIWLAKDSGEYYVGVTSVDNDVIVKTGIPLPGLPCEWSYGVSGEGGAYTLTIDPIDVTEDHANVKENATLVTLGDGVEGSLEYERDTDYFRFPAKAGKVYRMEVTLGTLEELWVDLEDSDGEWLTHSYGRSPALRLDWYAQSTGDYYLTVSSHYMKLMGTYTLTITQTDITDDHANNLKDATPFTVGEPAEGSVDYQGDVDFFQLRAKAGQDYRVGIVLVETLEEARLMLYDSDGRSLSFLCGLGTILYRGYWQAPGSGDYYISVEAHGDRTGAYELIIAER